MRRSISPNDLVGFPKLFRTICMRSVTSKTLVNFPPHLYLNQPHRTAIYHYALRPLLLKPDEPVKSDEERLFKPVIPPYKWEHTSSNFDPVVAKITGMITHRGARDEAREIMRRICREIKLIQLEKLQNITSEDEKKSILTRPSDIINEAVKNCTPLLVLNSVVRGGILYKVPCPPSTEKRARHMAIQFLIDASKDKPHEIRIWKSFAREFIAASQNHGKACRFKEQLHKQCEENRAYANYRIY